MITDRARHQIKYSSVDGDYQSTIDGFFSPCNFDFQGDTMNVPDLNSRITLLNEKDEVLTQLAYDAAWQKEVDHKQLRTRPETSRAGKFVHPHDCRFDRDRNIIVTEWVKPGRIAKLTRLQ